jgi:hypothetical protein
MVNSNIISFAGKMESGKTELAKVCEEFGYTKISFATPLKILVCNMLDIDTIQELNGLKKCPIGRYMSRYEADVLQMETDIPFSYIQDCAHKLNPMSTARDWLQIVGTDILRAWDNDWHVKAISGYITPGKKYVFDDNRFGNELSWLKSMDASCWYVKRPSLKSDSKHISENLLNEYAFGDNIIVNDGTLDDLKKKMVDILKN